MAFGGTIKLTGENEYRKALNDITNNLKVLNSEMKVVTSQYDSNDRSVQNLSQQQSILTRQFDQQQDRVRVLGSALADATEETGANSDTTKQWQIAVNEAQAELNRLGREVDANEQAMRDSANATDESTDAIDDFGREADDSGKSALKLGDIIKANLISEGIMAGLKGLASAVKAVGSAFFDIGKQAVQSYAEYEQLVGGVETLFGSQYATMEEFATATGIPLEQAGHAWEQYQARAETVIENANNAYKTAGMNTNEYMETVTSFSASLNASLGEYSWQSANYADIAIRNMSDNANKMGTDMEMIKNAYQGFAKQNFTMLDNLKLGYGGTKTEMERLLRDAEQMAGYIEGSLSVDNFADIIDAIDIVQSEMGITGTTAKEASKTISGSTGSMKSAWENLVAGIANDNANFEQLVNNLVESIVGVDGEGGVLNNMLPRIETAIGGIVQMVVSLTESLLPQVMQMAVDLITTLVTGISEGLPALLESASTILNTLIDGIMTVLPTLIPVALQMIVTLVKGVLENLPLILQTGMQMLTELINGITETIPELIPVMIDTVILLVDTLLDNIDMIIEAGINLLIALADGLIDALPKLIEKIPVIIDKLVNTITNNLPYIIEMGIELTIKLAEGLIKAIPQLLAKVPQIITSIVTGLSQGLGKIAEVGGNLVKGLWDGIQGLAGWLWDKVTAWCGDIWNGILDFFGIASPSKQMKWVGNMLVDGLAGSIDENGDEAVDSALAMSENVMSAFDSINSDGISSAMAGISIPNEISTSVTANYKSNQKSTQDMMVSAFKQALTEVKVVMNNREMGAFVTNTIERVVYA